MPLTLRAFVWESLLLSILSPRLAASVAAPLVRSEFTRRAHVIYGIRVEAAKEWPHGALMETDAEGPVLYGIYTSNVSDYTHMLDAQFETWAKDLPRKDIVVSGSHRDDAIEGLTSVPLNCSDAPSGQPCKEGTLLFRARARARERNADWFVSATEDKYIWTAELERALARLDSSVPVVYAVSGCGRGRENASFIGCEEVYKNGGMCGGPTYVMSRAALDSITSKPDETYEEFMKEYLANVGVAHASDIVTSCLLYKRNIPMKWQAEVNGRTRGLGKLRGNDDGEIFASAMMHLGKDSFIVHLELGGNKSQVPVLMHEFYKHEQREF